MAKNQKKKRSAIRRFGSFLYNCILILMIAVAAVLIFNRINNRVTFFFDHAIIMVTTPSMEPEIPAGSCILIRQIAPEDVVSGDVITFYSSDPALAGNMNTHRVVAIAQGSAGIEFVTRGDNNTVEDRYTAEAADLVGKYEKVIPALTVVAGVLMSETGFYIIIAAFVIFIAANLIGGLKKSKRRAEEERQAEVDRRVAEEVERLMAEKGMGDDDKQ